MKTSPISSVCFNPAADGSLTEWVDLPGEGNPIDEALKICAPYVPATIHICHAGSLRHENGSPLVINSYDLVWSPK